MRYPIVLMQSDVEDGYGPFYGTRHRTSSRATDRLHEAHRARDEEAVRTGDQSAPLRVGLCPTPRLVARVLRLRSGRPSCQGSTPLRSS